MNASMWMKRTAAFFVVGSIALAAAGPKAEAGTTNGSFSVRTTVFGACTFTSPDLTFPNYTTGQLPAVAGSTAWTVTCPGASAGSPIPITFTMNPVGGAFAMTGPGTPLNYALCQGGACAPGPGIAFAAGAPGAPVTVNSAAALPYTLSGSINGSQTPTAGAYAQLVNVVLTY